MRVVPGFVVAGLTGLVAAASACNGNVALCSRLYSNISQLTSSPWEYGSSKHKRTMLMTWLEQNPNEVVTLLLTNGDAIPVSQFGEVFLATGLDQFVYTPTTTLTMQQWPTLQEMIDSGNRLIVFMDYHTDVDVVPYILNEFAYFFETPFDTTDKDFPECTLDRPAGASAEGRMYIVNHFLDVDVLGIYIPDQIEASSTNSLKSIKAQADLCLQAWGRMPNVILLDWINIGDAIQAQDMLNNL
ncbi:hypothetical protein VTK73DRAFT_3939 [Phialemonium thermophilum]|uniref:Uncharacterized protein n=1 Tax=Phialemonium thermophilum TaxID=223376 RepID=A0ABR3XZH3_9PEZI